MGVGTSTVGAIIASRRTHNPIGWLLCASGLVFGVVMFASEYAIYTLLGSPGSLPAGEVLAPVNPLWVLGFNLFVLILILFPTGQLPSARPREVLGNEMQCAHELAERSREASSQGSQNLPIHCPGGRLIMH
jgi:hypothetical protein